MRRAVQIETGDYICINVSTSTVWIEKGGNLKINPPSSVPQPPRGHDSKTKRHFPVHGLFTGVKDGAAWKVAYSLAYAVAWVMGLSVGDETEMFLETKNTYIFCVQ